MLLCIADPTLLPPLSTLAHVLAQAPPAPDQPPPIDAQSLGSMLMGTMPWFIPPLIFLARICDVSVGTVRMIFLINGSRVATAILGFCEVTIWALAVGGLVKYLTNPLAIIAFAGGYSAGTLVGLTIERKLAIGWRLVRVINPDPDIDVSQILHEHDVRATRVEGRGMKGPVEVTFSAIRRRDLPSIMKLLQKHVPAAYVTIERADRASTVTPQDPSTGRLAFLRRGLLRK